MENPSISSSGKVKVEYSDPSGIFPLISKDLESRLPLRNLHWNSVSRPLRSIYSLYIELVLDETSVPHRRAASSAGLPEAHEDLVSQPAVQDARRGSLPLLPKKERRHQIPGLRQTPYLKVYLLRCDDTETYKSSARKLLREWVKAHTPPSQSSTSINSQENHDAFEWMIIHVVLPDVQNSSPWPNKSSISVLDKIRADFNGSSKSATDRVAQIPATRSLQVQGTTVNPVPTGLAREEFLRETSRAWEDVLVKVKALILTSFDLRVRQYEEDIKEKSSQRSLPGWNFCTFFVLKEGLARGFESVGLVEDALMGYDELSVELQVAIEEQREKATTSQETGIFREYTEELHLHAESAISKVNTASSSQKNTNTAIFSLLDANSKQYRELILASNISVFDFQTYVFARQISLLSRMASISQPLENTAANGKTEDMMILAEICRRAVDFITSMGGIIRKDLRTTFESTQDTAEASSAMRFNVVENMVASWTFSSCQQILSITAPDSLVKQIRLLSSGPIVPVGSASPDGTSLRQPTHKSSPLPSLPIRTTSLLGHAASKISPNQESFLEDLTVTQKSPHHTETQTGSYVLAGQRAQLYLVARRILYTLGVRNDWRIGWSGSTGGVKAEEFELEEVSLHRVDQDRPNRNTRDTSRKHQALSLDGIHDDMLSGAMSSRSSFYSAYQNITTAACDHYKLSGDHKSAQAMVADIALIRYDMEDYAGAASYFHQLAPFYAQDDWADLESSILDIYAQCLKKLDRWDEFIKIALKLLAKAAYTFRQNVGFQALEKATPSSWMSSHGGKDETGYLDDLLTASKRLKDPISTQMSSYFADIKVGPYISHFEDKDGFRLDLNLRYLLSARLEVQQVQIRLVSVTEGQARDIWLSSEEPFHMKRGPTTMILWSNMLIPGWYIVDKIVMRAGKVLFMHNHSTVEGNRFFAGSRASMSSDGLTTIGPRIMVWPAERSFAIRASLHREIHLEQPRSILCELSSGRNAVLRGTVHIRAASAGLRLHTANTEMLSGAGRISDVSQAGFVHFEQLPADTITRIKVPYRLDTDLREISLRTEVAYTTSKGEFVFGESSTLSVLLPLGVNVHDVFKQDALFSKFSISTSTSVPLRLLDCHLEGTDDFEASSPKLGTAGLCVFVKQPISMVYKIIRKEDEVHDKMSVQARLSMQIQYMCLDEEILAVVLELFRQSLQKSKFSEFSCLLTPYITATLRERLTLLNLEIVGLLRGFSSGTFQDFHWQQILVAIPPKKRMELVSWLTKWHEDHAVISLPSTVPIEQVREIIIPVDVPQTQVVHTAELRLLDTVCNGRSQSTTIGVGHSVPAELILNYSRKWDTQGKGSNAEPEVLEFYYELGTNPDTWLIGGRRRAQYIAKEHEIVTFPVLLIPQRAGHLMYPSIEIKDVRDTRTDGQSVTSPPSSVPNPPTSCEVDYLNQGQSILVVANLASTTVNIDSEEPLGGAWLVESQARRETANG